MGYTDLQQLFYTGYENDYYKPVIEELGDLRKKERWLLAILEAMQDGKSYEWVSENIGDNPEEYRNRGKKQ